MNVDQLIERAQEWARRAPNYRSEDFTPADCYSRANYHLLLALLALVRNQSVGVRGFLSKEGDQQQ